MGTRMNRFVFLLLFIIIGCANLAWSQKTYFAYLQTEQQQPFYVTFGGRNLSSSSIGYLILPKLTDSVYTIRVGFPNNNQVQDYDIRIKGNDEGFLIKNFAEKGWGLSNLLTSEVQMSGTELRKRQNVAAEKRAAAERRKADSLQVEMAKKEAARRADSIEQETARLAQEKRTADSLNLVAQMRATDSINAENARIEAKRAADERAALLLVQRQKTADSLNTLAQQRITESVQAENEKAEAKKLAAAAAAAKLTQKQRTADSLNALVQERKTDSIKAKVARLEAKKAAAAQAALLLAQQKTADSLKLVTKKLTADSIRAEKEKTAIAKASSATKKSEPATTVSEKTSAVETTILEKPTTLPVDKEEVPIIKEPETVKSKPALKLKEATTDTGYTATYKDGGDTIKVFIPSSTKVATKVAQFPTVPAKEDTITSEVKTAGIKVIDTPRMEPVPHAKPEVVTDNDIPVPAKESKKETTKASPKFLDMELSTDTASTKTAENGSNKKKVVGLTSNNSNTRIVVVAPSADSATTVKPVTNANCKVLADEKDFYSVRKKMVSHPDPESMVSTAKKAFKEKCYSTSQLRNLCVLFLSDAAKYNFLDAAYPYVSDAVNFASLSDLLQESYYVNRFNAMIK